MSENIIKKFGIVNLEDNSDLQYIFDRYIFATERGKPNPTLFKQLIAMLEAKEIYLIAKQKFLSNESN